MDMINYKTVPSVETRDYLRFTHRTWDGKIAAGITGPHGGRKSASIATNKVKLLAAATLAQNGAMGTVREGGRTITFVPTDEVPCRVEIRLKVVKTIKVLISDVIRVLESL